MMMVRPRLTKINQIYKYAQKIKTFDKDCYQTYYELFHNFILRIKLLNLLRQPKMLRLIRLYVYSKAL